jgi:PKD repeat protein
LIKYLLSLTLISLFVLCCVGTDSYSCGGSETFCSNEKTRCLLDAGTINTNCTTLAHLEWDRVPCINGFTYTCGIGVLNNNGDLSQACLDDPICVQCVKDKTPLCLQTLTEVLKGCGEQYTANQTTCNNGYDTCIIPCVSIGVSYGANGTISSSGSIVGIQPGENRTFYINPNPCYEVEDVLADGISVGKVGSYTFYDLTEDHAISASFVIKELNITTTAGVGGTITPFNPTITCGESQTFSITPDDCYHIVNVTVDGVSKGPITQYPLTGVTANHVISATFSNVYSLAVSKTPMSTGPAGTGAGAVTSSPAGIACDETCPGQTASFPQNCPSAPSTVTLNATPDSDSSFAGWSGACSSDPCILTMDGDKQVTATFNILPPIAAFTASATTGYAPYLEVDFTNQSIRPWPAYSDTYTWDFGDGTTSNEANPLHVYRTVGSYPVTLTVKNPTASNTSLPINITVASCPDLPVRVVHPDNTVSGYFATLQEAYSSAMDGESIQALAVNLIGDLSLGDPKSVDLEGGFGCGYQAKVGITSLQGMVSVNSGVLSAGDLAIVADPTDNIYQVVATAGFGGGISDAGTSTLAKGSSKIFTITPNPNYFILDVLVDGLPVGPVDTYEFSNVSTNHTIEAIFSTTYTVNATAGPNGSIAPAGLTNVVEGNGLMVLMAPEAGYHVADVLVDGVSVGAVDNYIFESVLADRTIAASFAINTYTITATATSGGSITPSGAVAVTYGASQAFTWSPNPGFTLLDVLVDGVSVGAVSTYTFDNVSTSHTIVPVYANTLTINMSGFGTGTVTSEPAGISCGGACSAEFSQGTEVILTAEPDANSLFAGWSGVGCTTGTCTVTLNENTTVTAIFALKPPVADFTGTPTTAAQNVTVNFTDLSALNPTGWLWEFGDGTTSSLQNPTHTYSVVGTYAVRLTATNAGGSNTVTKTSYVVVQPYVRVLGSSAIYRSIQEAYDAAPNGSTIQVRDLTLAENLNVNSVIAKTIYLEGGCNFDYSIRTGSTRLKGLISTITGTTFMKNFELQN